MILAGIHILERRACWQVTKARLWSWGIQIKTVGHTDVAVERPRMAGFASLDLNPPIPELNLELKEGMKLTFLQENLASYRVRLGEQHEG